MKTKTKKNPGTQNTETNKSGQETLKSGTQTTLRLTDEF